MSPATRRRMRNRIGRGLTFEKVWATIERNAEEARERYAEWEARWQKEVEQRQKEAEERKKEAAEREAQRQKEAAEREAQRQKEAEQRKKETDEQEAKWQKEAEERKKKADEQQSNLALEMHYLDMQIGGLHNSFGEMAEFMIAPAMVDLFDSLGYYTSEDLTCNKIIRDEKGHILTEVDLLLGNAYYLFAIEIKTSLGKKDIEHHRKRLEIIRKHINRVGDRRKIRGGLAIAVMKEKGRKAILDAGFYPIEPSGIKMKTDLPEGFVPREF